MQETRVRSLGQEDPLEEEMTATPVFLPGESLHRGLQSMEWQSQTLLNLPSMHTCRHLEKPFRIEIFFLQWLLSRSVPYTLFMESPLKLMMYVVT